MSIHRLRNMSKNQIPERGHTSSADRETHGGSRLDETPSSTLRVLRLTLKRKWFDMIASGEKREEYREPKDWIFSRLIGKDYNLVEFSNGYGKKVPKVTVSFLGWHQGTGDTDWGAIRGRNYVVIRLGDVISLENTTNTQTKEETRANT